jgi:hypothetical protein
MAKHGNLNVPVIGVAGCAPDFAALKARARESVEKHGGLDPAAFDKLVGLLRYARGREVPSRHLHRNRSAFTPTTDDVSAL